MKNLTVLKPSLANLLFALLILSIALMVACEADEDSPDSAPDGEAKVADLDCSDLEEDPNRVGDAPLGPPPALPNIFTGTAFVNGEPAPEGEQLYVKLVTSRSHSVEITENGQFRNIIHGPVSELDQDVEFQFCLGDPEGLAVKSNETFEFDGSEPFKESEIEINFPMLPDELSAP